MSVTAGRRNESSWRRQREDGLVLERLEEAALVLLRLQRNDPSKGPFQQ